MVWQKEFKAQTYNQPTFKHKELPIFATREFDFFRCVPFEPKFYGVTANELFKGNLRYPKGRYSSLFPNQKLSYWAESRMTATAEIKKHGSGANILAFWAYDDGSSFIPCHGSRELLYIVDGRKCGIQDLIDKADCGIALSEEESKLMSRLNDQIKSQSVDAIVYDSRARKGGENYIFLECGFKKLALGGLELRFGRKDGGNHNSIDIVVGSDYVPCPKEYGKYFARKCKVKMDSRFLRNPDYIEMQNNVDEGYRKLNRRVR